MRPEGEHDVHSARARRFRHRVESKLVENLFYPAGHVHDASKGGLGAGVEIDDRVVRMLDMRHPRMPRIDRHRPELHDVKHCGKGAPHPSPLTDHPSTLTLFSAPPLPAPARRLP